VFILNFEIKDISEQSILDAILICIPEEKRDDPLFKAGIDTKGNWALKMLKKYGCFVKVAYVGSKLVGLIQYEPIPRETVVEIDCIFVYPKSYQHKGIGKALLEALIEDMKKPKPYFNNKIPNALITYAFETPAGYPQNKFFEQMGFKRVREDDPFFLYYPLIENYKYVPRETKYKPQEEDKGKGLIFMNPNCPFCIDFTEKIKESIKEVADIPIRVINVFEEPEEVTKRGSVPFCTVNGKPIQTFFTDKENFQKEVKTAISASF